MANLLDVHADMLSNHIANFGVDVKLISPTGDNYDVKVLWKDISYIPDMKVVPELSAESQSIFIDYATLDSLGILQSVGAGWRVEGSPNRFMPTETLAVENTKPDNTTGAVLLFLRSIDNKIVEGGL